MATLTTQSAVATGLHPSYVAAAASQTFQCDGRTMLHVKNGDVGSHSVTITSKAVARAGLSVADAVVAVPAGEERMILLDPTGFADPVTGLASITYSAITVMTVAAIRV